MKLRLAAVSIMVLACSAAFAQTTTTAPASAPPATAPVSYSPDVLPGNGLAQHDFLFTGEYDTRKPVATISLVQGGKVTWQYQIPTKDESNGQLSEFSDMHMCSNGDVVFAYKTGWRKVNHDKETIYDYKCPKGEGGYNECHSAQPIGNDKVLFMENGTPHAVLRLYNIATKQVEMEHVMNTKEPVDQKSVHGQFRNVRMLDNGHYLISHMNLGKVIEYDQDWKEIWSCDAKSVWDAIRLKNGNTLVSGNQNAFVQEIDPSGKIVWEFKDGDAPGYKIFGIHQVTRLENGNTVITNWCPGRLGKNKAAWPNTVQLVEVTPDKQVVWGLRQWSDPDLGTSSCVQFLDQGWTEEKSATH